MFTRRCVWLLLPAPATGGPGRGESQAGHHGGTQRHHWGESPPAGNVAGPMTPTLSNAPPGGTVVECAGAGKPSPAAPDAGSDGGRCRLSRAAGMGPGTFSDVGLFRPGYLPVKVALIQISFRPFEHSAGLCCLREQSGWRRRCRNVGGLLRLLFSLLENGKTPALQLESLECQLPNVAHPRCQAPTGSVFFFVFFFALCRTFASDVMKPGSSCCKLTSRSPRRPEPKTERL